MGLLENIVNSLKISRLSKSITKSNLIQKIKTLHILYFSAKSFIPSILNVGGFVMQYYKILNLRQ